MKALREKLMSHLQSIGGQRIRRAALIERIPGKLAATYLFELTELISG